VSLRLFLLPWAFIFSLSCSESNEPLRQEKKLTRELKTKLMECDNRGKLIFTFSSLAYTVDSDWGQGVPKVGMERLAKIAHRHKIPITWLIDPGSGLAMKQRIDEWHQEYGDDIGLIWGHSHATPTAYRNPQKALDSLRLLFPWSKVDLAAAGSRSNALLHEIMQAGMSSLWGSCWEQVGIDRITDRGAPWGFFYAADDCFKIPSLLKSGLVSVEWTARDLLKSIHSHAPTIYSSDPDDVGRTDLCTGENIEYWKGFFDNYIRNIAHNPVVFFPQHQESHEMEYSDACREFSPEEVAKSEKMLDLFFTHVRRYDNLVEFMTVPQAVNFYRDHFTETEPCAMLFDDIPAAKPPFWYAAKSNRASGPWPRTLLYYDKECQVVFIEDQIKPILLRDYIHNRHVDDPDFFAVARIPEIKVNTPWERREFNDIPLEIISERNMPYAAALWYDFNRFRVDAVVGAKFIGPIENSVLLLRLDLIKGVNKIFIKLKNT